MKATYYHGVESVVYVNENPGNVMAEVNNFCHRNPIEVLNIIVRPSYDVDFPEWEGHVYFRRDNHEDNLKW